MIYEENQFTKIVQWLPEPPKWFILGGPADANEAQTAVSIFLDLKVVAVEPLQVNVDWQLENGFPSDGVLVLKALGERSEVVSMFIPPSSESSHRASSLDKAHEGYGTKIWVETTTIDSLNERYGPFDKCLLWLDIEGSEYPALLGASRLLSEGKVIGVNIEVARRDPESAAKIDQLLKSYGLTQSFIWNERETHYDCFYRKHLYDFAEPEMSSGMRYALQGGVHIPLHDLPVKCLEVGVYDGRNACWLLDNVLNHPESTYTGVDYIGEHQLAHDRAVSNLSIHQSKVELVIGDSLEVLPKFVLWKRRYDLIFVDGCHSFLGCLSDLRNCWRILNPGGFIILDDYLRPDYGVAEALYTFLLELVVKTDYRITHIGYGVCIQKTLGV